MALSVGPGVERGLTGNKSGGKRTKGQPLNRISLEGRLEVGWERMGRGELMQWHSEEM
jgi:hypothetical protein